MKIKKCEKCDKELRLLGGYSHPTLGKEFLLCSCCFDIVNESVEKWREFVIVNSFNNEYYKKSLPLNLKNKLTSFVQLDKDFTKC